MPANITINDLLVISSHDPDRPSRVPGLRPTGAFGKWAATAMTLTTQASVFTRDSADVRASGLSPRLRAERLQETFATFAGRLETAAREIRGGAETLRQRINDAGRLGYDNLPAAVVHLDLHRLQKLDAMTAAARARVIAELAEAPATNLALAESLVRLPVDLTGMSVEAHAALRVNLWAKTSGSDAFTAMDAEMSELRLAQSTVREAVGACVDLGVGASALQAAAPTAAELAASRFPLAWPSARAALAEAA